MIMDETTKKELAEMLIKYGWHKPGCNRLEASMYRCSCGWSRAADVAMAIAFGTIKGTEKKG